MRIFGAVSTVLLLCPQEHVNADASFFHTLSAASVPSQVFRGLRSVFSAPFAPGAPVPDANSWYDCGDEESSTKPPLLKWWNITTLPEIWSPGTHQLISKTFSYEASDDSDTADADRRVEAVRAVYANSYLVQNPVKNFWLPFLYIPSVDECAEHDDDSAGACPLVAKPAGAAHGEKHT